jgi:type VI secretion system protein ImpH
VSAPQGPQEPQGRTLAQRLEAAPHLFDPDMARHVRETLPDMAPENLAAEVVSNPTNRFEPVQLTRDDSRAGDRRIAGNYLGLVGPVAALPSNYTHAAIAERKRRSASFFDFLELFAAELRLMFIDAHRKYRLPSLFQLYRTGQENRITSAVFALMGFATPKLRSKLTIHEELPLYYAGFFSDQRRTAVNLELMVNDFLGLPVEVIQFQKRRLPIPEDEQTRLGNDFGANAVLGQTAVGGASYLDRSSAVRVRIGPVDYAQYLSLMPDRKLYPQLTELIRLYCGPSISFDLQVVLSKDAIPQTRLDARSPVGRLGWDTWAIQSRASKDSEDTVFDPDLIAAVTR